MQIQKILLLLLIMVLPLACQTAIVKPDAGQMRFNQARDVVLSMQSIPLSTPPRKLDDILAILEQPENQHPDIAELFQRADNTVPAGRPPVEMYQYPFTFCGCAADAANPAGRHAGA